MPTRSIARHVEYSSAMDEPASDSTPLTASGFELAFGTNHVGHVVLTTRLLGALGGTYRLRCRP